MLLISVDYRLDFEESAKFDISWSKMTNVVLSLPLLKKFLSEPFLTVGFRAIRLRLLIYAHLPRKYVPCSSEILF
jgi:hypothetical protein